MNKMWWDGFIVGCIIGMLIGLFLTPAFGHEWYDSDCCSATDCYEIDASEVMPVKEGWLIKRTGEILGYHQKKANGKLKVRRTPKEAGGTFHRCSFRNGDPDASTICLYIPDMGF